MSSTEPLLEKKFELDAVVEAFKKGTLKPKILTLGQEEQLDDCTAVNDAGAVVPDVKAWRRLLLSLCYDIPEPATEGLPSPVMKDMLEAARVANMGTDEKKRFLLAKKKLQELTASVI